MLLETSRLRFELIRFIALAKNDSCFSLESMDECVPVKLCGFSGGDEKGFRFGDGFTTNAAAAD